MRKHPTPHSVDALFTPTRLLKTQVLGRATKPKRTGFGFAMGKIQRM